MLSNYYKKFRGLMQDDLTPGEDYFEFISSLTFTLSMSTIDSTTLHVYVNGTEQINTSGVIIWTYLDGRVIFSSGSGILAVGDVVEMHYQGYQRYTDAEIRQYLLSSIIRLSTGQYQTFVLRSDDTIFPTPVESDENLICLVASILAEGSIARYKTAEIEIEFGREEDGETRIRKLLARWKKCYGVVDYIKINYNYQPTSDSNLP